MGSLSRLGLAKSERIHSRTDAESIFLTKGTSVAIYPLRIVWNAGEKSEDSQTPSVRFIVSVPKKRFRHAVDRNRMKRQVREAFRLNKHILWDKLQDSNLSVDIAFISIADKPAESWQVRKSVMKSIIRIADSL